MKAGLALPSRQILRHLGETLLIGVAGGILFNRMGIPAGYLSGAMILVGIAALAGRPMTIPAPLARVVSVLIGISLGGAVTPETLQGISTWPLSVAVLCIGMTCATFGSALYLRKVHGWDMLSALFGSSPGALSQVILHATQYHSDLRGIAFVQTVRVVILTACVPVALSLFGLIPTGPVARPAVSESMPEILALAVLSTISAILAHYVRFPGGLIFGAMLASAVLHGSGLIHAGMPWWVVAAAMISLGSLSGSRFANTDLRLMARHLAAALGSFSVAVAIVSVFAAVSAYLVRLPISDIVVSFSPGALDAMMIVALALHLDPIFVGAHHVARFLLVSLSLPVFVKLYAQTPPPPPAKPPQTPPVRED